MVLEGIKDRARRFIEYMKEDPYVESKHDRYLPDGTKVKAGTLCRKCNMQLFNKETGEYEKCFFCGENVVGNGDCACYDIAGMRYHVCGKCVLKKYKEGQLQSVNGGGNDGRK